MSSNNRPSGGARVIAINATKYQFMPGQITLKRGEPVKLQLTSDDVTHGLFLKDLAIDTEIVPGTTTELMLTPQKAGKFTAICVHYCGPGHGGMHMKIDVE